MAVKYDPQVVTTFAQKLYDRASGIVLAWAFLGFVAGVSAGYAASSGNGVAALIVGALGVAIGAAIGSSKAFMLKLQAQQALCQIQIEWNTRRAADLAQEAAAERAKQSTHQQAA